MNIFRIAKLIIKSFFNNLIMLPILIGVPIFQIFIMDTLYNRLDEEFFNNSSSIVEVIIIGGAKSISMVQQFAVSILVMYVLISGIIAATTIIAEKEERTLMRVFTAPVKKSHYLIGSLIGYSFLLLLTSFTIIYLSYLLFNIDWGTSYWGLFLATFLLGSVSLSIAFVSGGLFKSSKIASGIMSFTIVVMTFLSGGLTQNGGFGLASRFTINWWGYDIYMRVIEGGSLIESGFSIIVLTAIALILTLFGIYLYGRNNIYE
ncbi:ABC transporter permease [Alkaliphilus pronyensis]|uniref:ABC transporter permease n=1 Tax=Alkaliphilus pronyensis TaxID=1482732 RepID=A0A6I0EXX4_9FIRM|nr:ABC transporter permease [Alkaliphilus pronyensis]KAB3532749.1 ABC transporter permease [Alkaliphilus pronyensis]